MIFSPVTLNFKFGRIILFPFDPTRSRLIFESYRSTLKKFERSLAIDPLMSSLINVNSRFPSLKLPYKSMPETLSEKKLNDGELCISFPKI